MWKWSILLKRSVCVLVLLCFCCSAWPISFFGLKPTSPIQLPTLTEESGISGKESNTTKPSYDDVVDELELAVGDLEESLKLNEQLSADVKKLQAENLKLQKQAFWFGVIGSAIGAFGVGLCIGLATTR